MARGDVVTPLGVVLAGGAGRRLGQPKASAWLGGRPLIERPLAALARAVSEVVVVAKADTPLPALEVDVWHEPAVPRHPLAGIATALARANGRPVLACPVDLPFVDEVVLAAIASAAGEVVVAEGQPLLGRFAACVAPALHRAVRAGSPVRAALADLRPVVVEVADSERVLFNVNTPAELAVAEAMLAGSAAQSSGWPRGT